MIRFALVLAALLIAAPAASAGPLTWRDSATIQKIDAVNDDANTIACPSTALCVVGLDAGELAVSTNPLANPPTWSTFTLPVTPTMGFTTDFDHVRCTSAAACVAVSSRGDVFTSNDPADQASWSQSSLGTGALYPTRSFDALSCPAACVGFDGANDEFLSSGGPTASAYTAGPSPTNAFKDVSCSTAGLCLAVTSYGVWHSSNPAGGTDKWSQVSGEINITYAPENQEDTLDSVWCAPTFCLAGGHGTPNHKGGLYWTTSPATTDKADWHSSPEFISEVSRLACSPDGARCVAWKATGGFVFDATAPMAGVSAWHQAAGVTAADYVGEVSCPTVSTCFAVSLRSEFNVGIDTDSPDPIPTPTATPSTTPIATATATPRPTVTPTATPTSVPFPAPTVKSPPKLLNGDGSEVTIVIRSASDASATVRMVGGSRPNPGVDGVLRLAAIAKAKKAVTFGTGKGKLKAGKATALKVKLSKAGRKYFKQHKSGKVSFWITTTPAAGGATRNTTVRTTLRRPKKKHHQ